MEILNFKNILLVPAELSADGNVESVIMTDENDMYPFISLSHYRELGDEGIYVATKPNGQLSTDPKTPSHLTMAEFEELFIQDGINLDVTVFVTLCVNAHSRDLFLKIAKVKQDYKGLINLTVGVVSSPITFQRYAEIGVEAIIIGDKNLAADYGIGYPIASLIIACHEYRFNNRMDTQIIVAGINDKQNDLVADIVKAFACGADKILIKHLYAPFYSMQGLEAIKLACWHLGVMNFRDLRNQAEYIEVQ